MAQAFVNPLKITTLDGKTPWYLEEPLFLNEEDEWLYNIATGEYGMLDYLLTLPLNLLPTVNNFPKSLYALTEDLLETKQETATMLLKTTEGISANMILLVQGVNGHDENGYEVRPGEDLLLKVISVDSDITCTVKAINGPKITPSDSYCGIPDIPKGTLVTPLYYEQTSDKYLVEQLELKATYELTRIPCKNILGIEGGAADLKKMYAANILLGIELSENTIIYLGLIRQSYCEYQIPGSIYSTNYPDIEEPDGEKCFDAMMNFYFNSKDNPKYAIIFAGSLLFSDLSKLSKFRSLNENKGLIKHSLGDVLIIKDAVFEHINRKNSGFILNPNTINRTYKTTNNVQYGNLEYNDIPVDGFTLFSKGGILIDGELLGSMSNHLAIRFHNSTKAPIDPKSDAIFYLVSRCPGIAPNAGEGQLWQASYITGDDMRRTLVWNRFYED